MTQTFRQYMMFYQNYAAEAWHNIQPMEYGMLLVGIGVFGWILMKNASNR